MEASSRSDRDANKLVVLRLTGNPEYQEIQVALELGAEGKRPTLDNNTGGHLPPAPHFVRHLKTRQQLYQQFDNARALRPYSASRRENTQKIFDQCTACDRQLVEDFIEWLNGSPSFQVLEKQLRAALSQTDTIRVLVRSQEPIIEQLPWNCWDFIKQYPLSEVVYGALIAEQPHYGPPRPKNTIRILAIFGDDTGLDLELDRQLLEQKLTNAEIISLVQPDRTQVSQHLWKEAWDILFFAGHSDTDQGLGQLYLSPTETLPLKELSNGLSNAVNQGLQLAIFNSCNGLGLAHALADVNLPYAIVMRELLPQKIAPEFLKVLLEEFAAGYPLHIAQRRAREQLEGWEHLFPHASWLPVIIQNPAVGPLTWQQLLGLKLSQFTSDEFEQPEIHQLERGYNQSFLRKLLGPWQSFKRAISFAIFATICVVVIRSSGILQISELKAYDRFTQIRHSVSQNQPDPRLLVITIDENDKNYQGLTEEDNLSLKDSILKTLLTDKIIPFSPAAIGLDIYHPEPYEPELVQIIKKNQNYVGICLMDDDRNEDPELSQPTPNLTSEQIGFSDFVLDKDDVVRRQILMMTSGDLCKTSVSFNLNVVNQFLHHYSPNTAEEYFFETVPPLSNDQFYQYQSNGYVRLGDFTFKRIETKSGGYHLPSSEARGYQILINNRYSQPASISLTELLEAPDEFDLKELMENHIVLIGGIQTSQDRHRFSNSPDKQPGVMIHAHMISQLLDAAQDNRGIMTWWPEWLENLWIFAWALIAVRYVSHNRWKHISRRWLSVGIASIVGLVFVTCFTFFCLDTWIPLIPTALAIMIGAIVMVIFPQRFTDSRKQNL
ncbi:MAG: CHASE2 domain-containing protein [Cyanobacteria bacterium P01_H01_bin.21]